MAAPPDAAPSLTTANGANRLWPERLSSSTTRLVPLPEEELELLDVDELLDDELELEELEELLELDDEELELLLPPSKEVSGPNHAFAILVSPAALGCTPS
jgi:hypothetical protein